MAQSPLSDRSPRYDVSTKDWRTQRVVRSRNVRFERLLEAESVGARRGRLVDASRLPLCNDVSDHEVSIFRSHIAHVVGLGAFCQRVPWVVDVLFAVGIEPLDRSRDYAGQ